MKTAYYFCTRNKKATLCDAYISLLEANINSNNIFFTENNTLGLSKRYNIFLKENKKAFDNIVFLHDDVFIDDQKIESKLTEAHNQFDIVGLAGGINPQVTKPALWHLMCGGFQSSNLRGAVAHPISNNNQKIIVTSFGPTPSRTAILDGLFLSVKTNTILDWCFNENYNFHHYDVASCLDANRKKLKLGVYPIWAIHRSPGLLNPNDVNFLESQDCFIKEYKI